MLTSPLDYAAFSWYHFPCTSTTAAAGQKRPPAVQAAISLACLQLLCEGLTIYGVLGASKLHHSYLLGVEGPSNILLRPLLGICHSCTAGTMVSGPLAPLEPDSNNSRRSPLQQHAG